MFNQIVPEEMDFVNELLTKKDVETIVLNAYRLQGNLKTANFLDRLKELGFDYAMKGGISIGIDDVIIPKVKEVLIKDASAEVLKIQKQYERGTVSYTHLTLPTICSV